MFGDGLRHFGAVLVMVALAAIAVPADGALPPQNISVTRNDGEQIVLALAEREGMTDVQIVGTFSFFSCGYGCRADEAVIILTARDRRTGLSGQLAVCYDRQGERIREASGRMSDHPSCAYGSIDDVTADPANGPEEAR